MHRGLPHTQPMSFIASKVTALKYSQDNKRENETWRNFVFSILVVGTMLATRSILRVALQLSLFLIGSISVIAFLFNNPVFIGIFL